ncbi:septum site-determining protein MinC [Desulfosediminicola sp.]|uniref:septum site-determining protein MinC n=1 Tax=Desulfosediminicola sp. TaxID=2886825 RepID=UPI003AF2ECD2
MRQNNGEVVSPALEVKGSVLTIITLHIMETQPDRLYPQLEKKFGKAQAFFKNAPVILDLEEIDKKGKAELDFGLLVNTLREFGLVLVGVRSSDAFLCERVVEAGLGLLPPVKSRSSKIVQDDTEESETQSESRDRKTANESRSVAPTKVINQPVRSGQQVFAPEGDLVILSSVNAGAEVLAAGNIHIYGALRGRALAGINGDSTSRIFSLQSDPELIAIAGEYMVNESLDQNVLNHSAVFSLSDGSLKAQVVGSFTPT